MMKVEKTEYDAMLNNAKNSTIYAHAIVWIKAALEDKKTDKEQFAEIQKIMDIAINHLNS